MDIITMDCLAAATELRKLLVAHRVAGKQLSALEFYRFFILRRLKMLRFDDQISSTSQETLVSAIEGNKSQDLHLSLSLSVCEGVKVMYQNYQNKKWSQVQETARSIIQNLEGDNEAEQMAQPLTSSPPGGSTSTDKAADKWTMAYCEFYRDG